MSQQTIGGRPVGTDVPAGRSFEGQTTAIAMWLRNVKRTRNILSPAMLLNVSLFLVSAVARRRALEGGVGSKALGSKLSIYLVCVCTQYLRNNRKQETKVRLTWDYACFSIRNLFLKLENMQVRALLNDVQELGRSQFGQSFRLGGFGGRLARMTAPLRPGQPTKSEFGSGPGHYPHPESDYQSHRAEIAAPQDPETLTDQLRKFTADRRTDPTDASSGGYDDNIFLPGNPDQFGPQPALVKQPAYRPSGSYPQPVFRTGVTREE